MIIGEALSLGDTRYTRLALGVCLVLIVLFSAAGYGYGDTGEPLVFLVNAELVPIAYVENGVAKGVVVDIAHALGEKIERPIEVRAMNWVEAQAQFASGQGDALLHVNRTSAREEIYSFSSPLLQSEFVIFRRQADLDIRTIADLIGKRVGLEQGGCAQDLLAGYDSIEIFPYSAAHALELLEAGDLDALVMDRWIGEYELAKGGISGIRAAREPLTTSYSHIAVGKGNEELVDLINYGLKQMASDGTIARILNDWRGENVIYMTQAHRQRVIATAVVLVLMLISLISIAFVVNLKRLNQELEAKVTARTQELVEVNERLRRANEELQRQSLVDQLTQILNRRGFEKVFDKVWRISSRDRLPLALIMIDVDRFKDINDSHGHLAGDQCLRDLAMVLHENVRRPGDAVARLSGDEFACILYNTTEEGAVQVAEAMREQIEDLPVPCEGEEQRFSVSLGVAAVIPKEGMVPVDLVAMADRALYKAKGIGKNRVARASEVK